MNKVFRANRTRAKIHGTAERPRLTVHFSNLHITAQVIDDDKKVTLAYATTVGAKMTVRVCTGGYVDKTYGTAKVVGASSYYTYLPSTVYESGARTARLGFTRESGSSSFNAFGVWSPDSV